MYRFLTIEQDCLMMHSKPDDAPPLAYTDSRVITSVEQLHGIVQPGDTVMCSSSLDFPRESTRKRSVIALCRKIRGAGPTGRIWPPPV